MTVHLHVLPGHPKLGRHVEHWDESLAYAAPVLPKQALAASVAWKLEIEDLNQGSLGSCVPNTGTELLGGDSADGPGLTGWSFAQAAVDFQKTLGYSAFTATDYQLDEEFAQRLYAICTRTDEFGGQYDYPSGGQDTGSSGVGLAKAMVGLGLATGSYTHAFAFDALRTGMRKAPVPMGLRWYQSMFDTDPTGKVIVDRKSKLAGGHELAAYKDDVDNARIWFPNHWGQWGVASPPECGNHPTGWGYFSYSDLQWLLAQQGDATLITPVRENSPAPPMPPTPPVPQDADRTLWNETKDWAQERHVKENHKAAEAVLTWGAAKGFS